MINWIHKRNYDSTQSKSVNQNAQQSQTAVLDFPKANSTQDNSMNVSLVAEQQKVSEQNETAHTDADLEHLDDANIGLSPTVSNGNVQQLIDATHLKLAVQNAQQSQANLLDLSAVKSNQDISVNVPSIAEQQKVPESNETAHGTNVDLSPTVSIYNGQRSIYSTNVSLKTQASSNIHSVVRAEKNQTRKMGTSNVARKAAKRPRSKSMSAAMNVSRDVRLRLSPTKVQQQNEPGRRLTRISVPVRPFNYGMVLLQCLQETFSHKPPDGIL